MRILPSAVLLLCLWSQGDGQRDAVRLHESLFTNYSPYARPVTDLEETVQITMDLNLITILELDERNEVLITNTWAGLSWIDSGLTWNPTDFSGIESIFLPENGLWLPDIVIENSVKESKELKRGRFLVEVFSKGQVFWDPGDVMRTRCRLDVTRYPFDTQACEIRISSWMYTMDKVNLSTSHNYIGLDEYVINGEWDIVKTEAERFERLGYLSSGVRYRITLRRRRTFYVLNMIFPIALLSVLNVIVFILPVDSGEKITLSVTLLLSFTVFLTFIRESMPQTSDNLSLLALFVDWYLLLSALSVAVAAITLNARFRPSSSEIPHWLKFLSQAVKKSRGKLGKNSLQPSGKVASKVRFNGDDTKEPGVYQISKDKDLLSFSPPQAWDGGERDRQKTGGAKRLCDCELCTDDSIAWSTVAEALDFLFFWIFLVASLVTTTVIILVLSL